MDVKHRNALTEVDIRAELAPWLYMMSRLR